MSAYSKGLAQRRGQDAQRALRISRASSANASASGATDIASKGSDSDASITCIVAGHPAEPCGASLRSIFSASIKPARCELRSRMPDPDGDGILTVLTGVAWRSAEPQILETLKSSGRIRHPTNGSYSHKLNPRCQPRKVACSSERNVSATGMAWATAQAVGLSASIVARALLIVADRLKAKAFSCSGVWSCSRAAMNQVNRTSARMGSCGVCGVFIASPYGAPGLACHGFRVALPWRWRPETACGARLSLDMGFAPAIPREGENLRRARTVFASGRWEGGAAFHAATLSPASASVIQKPNHQIRRGA